MSDALPIVRRDGRLCLVEERVDLALDALAGHGGIITSEDQARLAHPGVANWPDVTHTLARVRVAGQSAKVGRADRSCPARFAAANDEAP